MKGFLKFSSLFVLGVLIALSPSGAYAQGLCDITLFKCKKSFMHGYNAKASKTKKAVNKAHEKVANALIKEEFIDENAQAAIASLTAQNVEAGIRCALGDAAACAFIESYPQKLTQLTIKWQKKKDKQEAKTAKLEAKETQMHDKYVCACNRVLTAYDLVTVASQGTECPATTISAIALPTLECEEFFPQP